MDDFRDYQGLVPYSVIFPDADEGVVGITLPRKVGKAKAGEYRCLEAYCVDPGCDCRRVVLLVLNDKGKQVAVIEFGFDPEDPMAGPYLSEFEKQSAAAEDLLGVFVNLINQNPAWLKAMCRHYKAVRKRVDGHAYRGRPFPKPGSVARYIKPPIVEDLFQAFQDLLQAAVRTRPVGKGRKKAVASAQESLFSEESQPKGIADWVERYLDILPFDDHGGRQTELRLYLYAQEEAAEDLTGWLAAEAGTEAGEARLEAGLMLLRDVLEILRVDLERNRKGAAQRMERWQLALAQGVFAPGVDAQLGARVTQALLDARVEILPLLHEANSSRMFAGLDADSDLVSDPEQALLDLLGEMEEEGERVTPHDLFEAILQMLAVGDTEAQTVLCRLMLGMAHPVIRQAAVLMLFHPQTEVRAGVAQVLAEVDGRCLTPETLRWLIVARNWFPETLRTRIDLAVANARRARVECAPMPKKSAMSVYASAIDGAQAQAFYVVTPQGKEFYSCSIMPKKGFGVADAFVSEPMGKRERDKFLAMLSRETGAVEVSADYLHQRICQALADGAAQGKVPCHWLVAIAERLGCDQWRAVPLDVTAELARLRAELERRGERFLTERYRQQALAASELWPEEQPFAWSWFEDDAEVDALVNKIQGKKRRPESARSMVAILEQILQPRRAQWLERLVLTALWLMAAKKPPVPWEQMLHVAEAVADDNVPLVEIPLMVTIAGHSFGAYMGRLEEGR